MDKIKRKVEEFFQQDGIELKTINMAESCRMFLDEMKKGLEGVSSSLAMIPSYIDADKDVPVDEPIIVLDAGGTNFRAAVVSFDRDQKPVIKDYKKFLMPGSEGSVSKDELFNTMAGYIAGMVEESSRIGFCFSYPVEMLPNKDGRLIRRAKEIQVQGVEGELIGENLLAALRKLGCRSNKRVVLINDTVAALMAGKSLNAWRPFNSFLGFILGTGMNSCYIEKNSLIKKIGGIDWENSMVINVESGAYDKFPRGLVDLDLDKTLQDPGRYVFEKMVSGAYFGKLVLTVVKKGAREGIFSAGCARELLSIKELTTKDVTEFLKFPLQEEHPFRPSLEAGQPEDSAALFFMIDILMERAALFAAINLSSLGIKSGQGHHPCCPICITAEGTTFYRLKGFQEKLNFYLKKFLVKQNGLYYEFLQVNEAVLVGTAAAGLTN